MAYDAQIRVNTEVNLNDFKKLNSEVERLEKQFERLKERGAINQRLGIKESSTQMRRLDIETEKCYNKLTKAREALQAFTSTHKDIGEIAKETEKVNGILQKFTKRVWGLAKRVFVFSLITRAFRGMVSAMREGLQNLAKFGGEYDKAMSAFKSQTAQLKNSLATAIAPVITAMLPTLTKFVAWLNTASDAMAKFFAILGGKSTYTKAKAQVVEYGKSLAEASKQAQKLASFDDLNVLDTASGGSASGGASAESMFEEVEIDKTNFEWVDWLRENLNTILGIVTAIGAGFLSWKILNLLTKLDPLIAGITTLVAGITAVIVAMKEWIQTGKIGDKSLAILEAGIIAIGFAISMILGSEIPALVSAIVALVVWLIAEWDVIWGGMKKLWEGVKAWWNQLATFFKGELKIIGNWFATLGKNIASGAKTLFTNIGDWLASFGKSVVESVKMLIYNIGDRLSNFVKKIRNGFASFVNLFIDGINVLIEKLNSFGFDMPAILGGAHIGFNIKKLDRIPMLAEGGIVNRPTMAMVGEAGREAVIPLENNTEFLDALGDRLSRDITIKFEGTLAQLAEVLQPALDAVSKRNGTQLRVN